MAHDSCIQCGDQTGPGSDSMEILIDGDAPAVTVCSYECLRLWAREKSPMKEYTCAACRSNFTNDELDHDGYGPVCPDCGNLM